MRGVHMATRHTMPSPAVRAPPTRRVPGVHLRTMHLVLLAASCAPCWPPHLGACATRSLLHRQPTQYGTKHKECDVLCAHSCTTPGTALTQAQSTQVTEDAGSRLPLLRSPVSLGTRMAEETCWLTMPFLLVPLGARAAKEKHGLAVIPTKTPTTNKVRAVVTRCRRVTKALVRRCAHHVDHAAPLP